MIDAVAVGITDPAGPGARAFSIVLRVHVNGPAQALGLEIGRGIEIADQPVEANVRNAHCGVGYLRDGRIVLFHHQ